MINTLDLKLLIKIFLGLILLSLVSSYVLFEFRGIITGPFVKIIEPENGQTLKKAFVEIKAETKNISFISLNDRPTTVDEGGLLSEKLLMAPGYNIIKIQAKDRFGRERVYFLELVYNLEG